MSDGTEHKAPMPPIQVPTEFKVPAASAAEKSDPYDGLSDLAPPTEDAPEEVADDKDLTAVAKEVLAGDWGDGAERRQKLADAGHDPNEVQKEIVRIVNE